MTLVVETVHHDPVVTGEIFEDSCRFIAKRA